MTFLVYTTCTASDRFAFILAMVLRRIEECDFPLLSTGSGLDVNVTRLLMLIPEFFSIYNTHLHTITFKNCLLLR
jgi:hypothetical protein